MDKSRMLYEEVRDVLRSDWDPIGIKDVRAASDEYDKYAMTIARQLISGTSVPELTRYLLTIETKEMGLRGDSEHARRIAVRLSRLPTD